MSHRATLDPHKVANRVCLQQTDAGRAGTGTRDTVVCGSIMVTYRWLSPSTPLIVNPADGVVIEGQGCLGFLHEPLLRIVGSGLSPGGGRLSANRGRVRGALRYRGSRPRLARGKESAGRARASIMRAMTSSGPRGIGAPHHVGPPARDVLPEQRLWLHRFDSLENSPLEHSNTSFGRLSSCRASPHLTFVPRLAGGRACMCAVLMNRSIRVCLREFQGRMMTPRPGFVLWRRRRYITISKFGNALHPTDPPVTVSAYP